MSRTQFTYFRISLQSNWVTEIISNTIKTKGVESQCVVWTHTLTAGSVDGVWSAGRGHGVRVQIQYQTRGMLDGELQQDVSPGIGEHFVLTLES